MAIFGQLSGYAKTNAKRIPVEVLLSTEGVKTILNAVKAESPLEKNLRKGEAINKILSAFRNVNGEQKESVVSSGDHYKAKLAEASKELGPELTPMLESFPAMHLLSATNLVAHEKREVLLNALMTMALQKDPNATSNPFIAVESMVSGFVLLNTVKNKIRKHRDTKTEQM